MLEQGNRLKCQSRTNCDTCGEAGVTLYTQLSDELFGTPGLWTFRRCANPLCGLIWLDPSPLPEELPKAYKQYFTHQTNPVSTKLGRSSLYKLGADAVKAAYLARRFGHSSRPRNLFQLLLALSIYVSPLHRAAIDMSCGLFSGIQSEGVSWTLDVELATYS
jgi:hypothetical protein